MFDTTLCDLSNYGFVIFDEGSFYFGDSVCKKLEYALSAAEVLLGRDSQTLARRHNFSEETCVRTPIFQYSPTLFGQGAFVNAEGLLRGLIKKSVLPVYVRKTGEIKDLMPLLPEDKRREAVALVHFIRERYTSSAELECRAGTHRLARAV